MENSVLERKKMDFHEAVQKVIRFQRCREEASP
jgi:hypothetical protein